MADVPARFKVDLREVRGAFGEIRRLGGSVGSGQFAGVTKSVRETNRELAAAPGFMSRFSQSIGRAAKIAAGLSAITVALVVMNRRWPAIGEVASKALGAITKGSSAAVTTTTRLLTSIGNLRVAVGIAAGIYTLAKAFRTLRSESANLPTPKLPGAGSGGLSAFKGGLAGGLAGVMGGALLRKAAAPVIGGLMAAGDFEQTKISYEVLAGGFEPAKKVLAEIQTMAAKTPFTLPGLADAGKTMLAFGLAADTIPARLKMLGDIAGGNQQKLDSAALVFGQISSAGRLMGQDLLQLVNLGFNPLQTIAEKTGESMVDLKKRMEDGKVSFAEVEGAFISATSAGGRFYQMTERQSGTFLGLISTMKDAVDAARRAFATPIMESLKPAIAALTEFFEKGESGAAAWGEKVAQVIDFVRAAFATMSGGEIFAALALGLRYAFQAGLDVLARGISAVFRASQDADFMGTISEKMREAAAVLKDGILAALQAMFTALSRVKGLGFLGDAAVGISNQRIRDREKEAARREREGAGPEVDLLGTIKKYFDESPKLFEGSQEELRGLLGNLLEPALAKAKEFTAERNREKTGGPDAKPTREGLIPSGGGSGGVVQGAFQRAINLIQGRTVNELVAAEAQKTNEILAGMQKTAAETRDNTKKTVDKLNTY